MDGLSKNQKKKLREKKNKLLASVKDSLGEDLKDVSEEKAQDAAK